MEDTERIDSEDVEHVAELARVRLTDDEAEGFVDGFNDVLGYFETLDDVPDDVEAEDDYQNVLRADEPEPSLSQEEALSNADGTEEGYFVGPSVS
ncbi:Asp-tRNA(Asn)/Glu-tRNA(Gln) amidotransferase subunit GatC [Haladaptatus sp. F3-133]|jgi:aspartyl-tRNA(Asn)/glutamyl-tRNA(Gln) amidotransferase subunit C|uniref:Aspartyl/glutamyl-tRNA(Asn/Gln) amidotransferase subunit C n=1 Tax=Halorutilus salinus TaxID=2487751 RepID=A0A9Q4C1I1_9EURY|nr:Asp-tRNA(Asn)/Glu-tRNA(Gln) amidotransferase subunit GatC [Halorutilus salinus]MCX2818217.1 Asp-tRNA(Asn)/Glu-tRNA(Gln) amidotransferase subunit GatC [Halorutilus salinus]